LRFWAIISLRWNPGILQGFLKTPELENRVFYGVLGVIFQILAGFTVYADWRYVLMNIWWIPKRVMRGGGPGKKISIF